MERGMLKLVLRPLLILVRKLMLRLTPTTDMDMDTDTFPTDTDTFLMDSVDTTHIHPSTTTSNNVTWGILVSRIETCWWRICFCMRLLGITIRYEYNVY